VRRQRVRPAAWPTPLASNTTPTANPAQGPEGDGGTFRIGSSWVVLSRVQSLLRLQHSIRLQPQHELRKPSGARLGWVAKSKAVPAVLVKMKLDRPACLSLAVCPSTPPVLRGMAFGSSGASICVFGGSGASVDGDTASIATNRPQRAIEPLMEAGILFPRCCGFERDHATALIDGAPAEMCIARGPMHTSATNTGDRRR